MMFFPCRARVSVVLSAFLLFLGLAKAACGDQDADSAGAKSDGIKTTVAAQHHSYQVFPGSAFNLSQMTDKTQWSYVAAHADGFYNHPVGWRGITPAQRAQIVANFKNKRSLLEGDLHVTPIVFPGKEGDIVGGEMAALGMSTMGLFENEVAPNKPQDTVAPASLDSDCDQYREFVRAAYAKLSAPTFLMTAAFQLDGDVLNRSLTWNSPVWEYMRKDILVPDSGGSGLDSPLDNYLNGPEQRRQAVWDMTLWTQRHRLKFIYLASPGSYNAVNFIKKLQLTVASLEDHDAEPDIYGIETYTRGFQIVPESNPDGSAAGTITGGAYYLLKHRDGDPGTLQLSVMDDHGNIMDKTAGSSHVVALKLKHHKMASPVHYRIYLSNTSAWLDYAPVLQAEFEGNHDWSLIVKSGDIDITAEVLKDGHLFYQKARLNPNTKQYVDLTLTRKTSSARVSPIRLAFSLMPHSGSRAIDILQFKGD